MLCVAHHLFLNTETDLVPVDLQLLLGHRPTLFTRTSMSAGSPDAPSAANPFRASKGSETVRSQDSSPDQPAASDEALRAVVHGARSPAQVHAASAGTSSMLLQQGQEHHDPSCCQPDLRQQSSSNEAVISSSASEQLQPPSTSESAKSATLPVNGSALLSLPSQLRSIRALSPTSAPQGGALVADSIHSSTGSPPNTPEASTDPNAQQSEWLASAMSAPISPANHASGEFNRTTALATPTHAELEARNSSESTDPSNLQEGLHTQSGTGLVSKPSCRSEHATVVSEPVSRAADDLMVSEPARGSADAVTASEQASSQPGTMSGSQILQHAPHVTSLADSDKPTVSDSPSRELPSLRLSQQAVSAQDDSLATLEAGAGTDAIPEPSTAGSDAPHSEHLEAASDSDTVPGPSTGDSSSAHIEQQATAFETDAITVPSLVGYESPHTEQQVTTVGSDAATGPSTAGSSPANTEQLQAAVEIDVVPGPSSLHDDSPQAERRSSSGAASASSVDKAAPDMSSFAQRLQAQKGTASMQ